MKLKKWAAFAAAGALAASLALFGCSSGGAQSEQKDDQQATGEETAYTLVQDGKLTVITSADWEPLEFFQNGDEIVGFDVDIVRAVAEEMGLELDIQNMQFDGLLTAIAAGGQADLAISGITVDPDRAKQVDFTESYYIDDLAIAAMKGGSVNKDNAVEELNKEGVIIAVQSGTSGEEYCQENFPNAKVQPYGNSTDCFAAMQSGQADYVCTNYAVVSKMLSEAYDDAEIIYAVATGEEYAIAVSKDNPELLAAVNEAIEKLKADGTIDELKAKWEV